MANDYFVHSSPLTKNTLARASAVNAILSAIEAGFDKFPSKSSIESNKVGYAAATGTDTLTVTLTDTITAYEDGQRFYVKIANTNTGPVTVNFDGVGAAALNDVAGSALGAGTLVAGSVVGMVYVAATGAFQLLSGGSGTASISNSLLPTTPGKVDANDLVRVDANKDIDGFNNIKFDGSLITGATSLNAADLAKIDAITNGTAAAGKAMVTDGSNEIGSLAKLGIGMSPTKELDVTGEIRASLGILFGTDTAAANRLDDYEEGTWTVVVSDTQGTPNTNSPAGEGTTAGEYTKIGNVCFFYIKVTNVNTTGLTAGDVLKLSLPLTTKAARNPVCNCTLTGVSLTGYQVDAVINAGAATLQINEVISGSSVSPLLVSEFADGVDDIEITGFFWTP